ncbi:MAG: hypothetical protein WCY74_02010 [Sphaerochaetaceae bacterium]|nr:hypothetical protein [Sphaerochaetaceae bacterium]MDD3941960.1 hypothetical protein [Sphaerochaetaceae bacterium]MDX9939204.1 hypothetical protein [Sphaerochaetaceae bacterium]
MKKVGVRILVVLLCMPMVFANPTETDSLPEGMPKAQEFTRVTIGLTSVLYVALAEFSYMMGEEIPGMSGSVDFMGNTTDVSWSDCDLGALFSEDPSDAGSMIIKHGTHKVHIAGDTLENMIDVTISYHQDDELGGTYHIEYLSRTVHYGEEGEHEEVVAFLVDGKDIQDSIEALENL